MWVTLVDHRTKAFYPDFFLEPMMLMFCTLSLFLFVAFLLTRKVRWFSHIPTPFKYFFFIGFGSFAAVLLFFAYWSFKHSEQTISEQNHVELVGTLNEKTINYKREFGQVVIGNTSLKLSDGNNPFQIMKYIYKLKVGDCVRLKYMEATKGVVVLERWQLINSTKPPTYCTEEVVHP